MDWNHFKTRAHSLIPVNMCLYITVCYCYIVVTLLELIRNKHVSGQFKYKFQQFLSFIRSVRLFLFKERFTTTKNVHKRT